VIYSFINSRQNTFLGNTFLRNHDAKMPQLINAIESRTEFLSLFRSIIILWRRTLSLY